MFFWVFYYVSVERCTELYTVVVVVLSCFFVLVGHCRFACSFGVYSTHSLPRIFDLRRFGSTVARIVPERGPTCAFSSVTREETVPRCQQRLAAHGVNEADASMAFISFFF